MKTRILACSVLYKESMEFFQPFIDSICNQNCTNHVDVLLVYEPDIIFPCSLKLGDNIIIEKSKKPVIIDNRIQCIDFARQNGYDYIFWIDSDDVCYPSKFSTIVALTADNPDIDIIVHDMSIIDYKGSIVRHNFIRNKIQDVNLGMNDVIDYNIMGFGNCIFKTENLANIPPIPEGIVAVDWWIVSILLLSGKRAKYLPISLTYYRQHNNNIAVITDFIYSTLQRQIEIIKVHFDALATYCSINCIQSYQIEHRRKLIYDYIIINDSLKIEIVKTLQGSKMDYVWWEFAIAYMKEAVKCQK